MRYFEPIGMVVLLIAVAWEVFLVQPLGALDAGLQFYGIKEQLYIIWDALAAEDLEAFRSSNYERFFDAYNPSSNVEWQLKVAQIVRYVLFAFGSLLIVVSKFREAFQK